jgi:CRISPR-associated endonuclease Csn1
LFFAIYETDAGKRTYETIPLNVVIEREKMGWLPVPEKNNKGEKLLFWLSPNDLVYLPTEEELMSRILSDKLDRSRIYKIVSFTGNRLYAIPYNVSNMIWDKNEYTQLNKVESTDMKESIKEICMPINVDRLGHITEIIIK